MGLINKYKEASGDFLDGSNESLKRAIKAARIFYFAVLGGFTIGIIILLIRILGG